MAGSALGTILRVTTWGESHGKGIGVVVDGCPAGLPLEEGDIQSYLNRRKPGHSKFTTARQEGDQVEILSGVFGGRTTGTPIALEVRNTDQRSHDYSNKFMSQLIQYLCIFQCNGSCSYNPNHIITFYVM